MIEIIQKLPPLHPAKIQALYQAMSPDHERLDSDKLHNLLSMIALHRASEFGAERLDANETALYQNALRIIGPARDVEYGKRMARSLVPIAGDFPSGAQEWGYDQYDRAGRAQKMSNLAEDFPKVEANATRFAYPVKPYGLGYMISYLDMQRAAFSRVPIQAKKIGAVTNGFEDTLEDIVGAGDPGLFTSLFANPNVPTSVVANAAGGTNSPVWGVDKTPLEVLADLLTPYRAIKTATKGLYVPDTLLLPTTKLDYVNDTYLTIGIQNRTILQEFLSRTRVTNVDEWHYLDTADAAGTGPAGFMYLRNPQAVSLKYLEPVNMPPFVKGAVTIFDYLAQTGGVQFEMPLTAHRFDGF